MVQHESFVPFQKSWLIAGLSLLVLGMVAYFLVRDVSRRPDVMVNLSSRGGSYKVGQPFDVEVKFEGMDAGEVTAAEIKVNFDPQYLRLESARPAGYFVNPLKVKWDIASGVFVLAKTHASVDTGKNIAPAIIFKFVPTSAKANLSVSLDQSSRVYVSKKGAIYPRGITGYYNISR